MTEIAVFGTIAGALIAWAAAECLRSRLLWTVGAVLTVVHSAAAFDVFYGWSHDKAIAATAEQTAAATGVAWGGGIYFNYALLLMWLADAIWWWVAPEARAEGVRGGIQFLNLPALPVLYSVTVRGFVWFMFLNGAIVFADGWMRILGILAVGTVSLAWLTKLFKQAAPAR